MKYLVHFLWVYLASIVWVGFYHTAAAQFYDLDDINKTLSVFEQSFNYRYDNIDIILHPSYIGSKAHRQLHDLINNNQVNLGYTQEVCLKEFKAQKKLPSTKKFDNLHLWVTFLKSDYFNNEKWFIVDAFIMKNDTDRVNFSARGLNPLAVEFNFSDFTSIIKTDNLSLYSGLAPFGRLPEEFFVKFSVNQTTKTEFFVKHIVVYDIEGKVKTLLYLKIEQFPAVKDKKRGWLVTDSGTMLKYYKKYGKDNVIGMDNVFIDYLDNRLVQYDLTKKSKYVWANISEPDAAILKIANDPGDAERENSSEYKDVSYAPALTKFQFMRQQKTRTVEKQLVEKIAKTVSKKETSKIDSVESSPIIWKGELREKSVFQEVMDHIYSLANMFK